MVHKLHLETQARFSIGDADETRYVNVAQSGVEDGQRILVAAPPLASKERANLSDVGEMSIDSSEGLHTVTYVELPRHTPEDHLARPRILAMLALTAFADHFTSIEEGVKTKIAITPEVAEKIGEDELRRLGMRRVTQGGELRHFSTNAMRLHAYGAALLRKTDARLLPLVSHETAS